MISFSTRGSGGKTESYLQSLLHLDIRGIMNRAGQAGVTALASATPRESSLAANSWTYEIKQGKDSVTLIWHNVDEESGFPVALMLQYGYATGTGGYVAGRDYINPAIEPIFEKIAEDVRKAVSS